MKREKRKHGKGKVRFRRGNKEEWEDTSGGRGEENQREEEAGRLWVRVRGEGAPEW